MSARLRVHFLLFVQSNSVLCALRICWIVVMCFSFDLKVIQIWSFVTIIILIQPASSFNLRQQATSGCLIQFGHYLTYFSRPSQLQAIRVCFGVNFIYGLGSRIISLFWFIFGQCTAFVSCNLRSTAQSFLRNVFNYVYYLRFCTLSFRCVRILLFPGWLTLWLMRFQF